MSNLDQEIKGYTMKEAIDEAKRCINCKNAKCQAACPIDNDIPDFISQLSKGNLGEAREILAKKTNLPAVCGRVCPHEKQCVGHCILNGKDDPIQVGKLEQFIADFDSDMNLIKESLVQKSRGKVAIIGSGPAGLTVAGDLAREGFNIVVYESESEPGGVLLYGIPEFRLPNVVVKREIERIASLGVTFITNIMVGEDITINEMFEQQFDAVFIGTGTALAKELLVPGNKKKGVYQSMYFLRMVTLFNEQKVYRSEVPVSPGDTVIIIGAGNVAMDAARTAVRLGAKSVNIVYHKGEDQLTSLKSEYDSAVAEGVNFHWNFDTLEIIGDEHATGILAERDGKSITLNGDVILTAIGSRPASRIISSTEGLFANEFGYVITKERPYGMTTLKGVFAGGDVVHSPATVVLAMKEAKKVAKGILAYVDAVKLLDL